jgi:hypothetical protein
MQDPLTNMTQNLPTPVNTTFFYPNLTSNVAGSSFVAKPLVLLWNGASVESFWYTRVITDLASRGYVVGATDLYRRPATPLPPQRHADICPNSKNGTIVLIAAGILNDIYNFIDTVQCGGTNSSSAGRANQGKRSGCQPDPAYAFLQQADLSHVVLLSHSLGGAVALDMITGLCDNATAAASGPNSQSCEGYSPLYNSNGENILQGVIEMEGYLLAPTMLNNSQFVTYFRGAYNNNTERAYEMTYAECAQIFQLESCNHYCMNDFVPNQAVEHQVTTCAYPAVSDPANYTTTETEHNQGVDLIAAIVDATVSGFNGQNVKQAQAFLANVSHDPLLSAGIVDIMPNSCFGQAGAIGYDVA